MDDQRVGACFRAVRLRRNWTQSRLADNAGVSSSLVSLIERGHLDSISLRVLRRVATALEIRLDVKPWLRAGDADRLLNAGHAAMHEELARLFDSLPAWLHAPEVSFAVYRDRGIIDILAFHPPTGSLLVVELKTELVSIEDLLGTMDVRLRLGAQIARDRGWVAKSVSAWVVIADSTTNRRRAADHRRTLRAAFPNDGRQLHAWLRRPAGTMRALSFWSNANGRGVSRPMAVRRRVGRRNLAVLAPNPRSGERAALSR